jgi:hypothetical protein
MCHVVVPGLGSVDAVFQGRHHFHTLAIRVPGRPQTALSHGQGDVGSGLYVDRVFCDDAAAEVRVTLSNVTLAECAAMVVLQGAVNLDDQAEARAASESATEALAESLKPRGGTSILTARERVETKERNRTQRESSAWEDSMRWAVEASRDAADDGELSFRFLCREAVADRMIAHLRTLGYSLVSRRPAPQPRATMIEVEVAP